MIHDSIHGHLNFPVLLHTFDPEMREIGDADRDEIALAISFSSHPLYVCTEATITKKEHTSTSHLSCGGT